MVFMKIIFIESENRMKLYGELSMLNYVVDLFVIVQSGVR